MTRQHPEAIGSGGAWATDAALDAALGPPVPDPWEPRERAPCWRCEDAGCETCSTTWPPEVAEGDR